MLARDNRETERQRGNLTGYPSIDKPWLKYYDVKKLKRPIPEYDLYENIWQWNKDYLDNFALRYYGNRITYKTLFRNINKSMSALNSLGVKQGDCVSFLGVITPELIYTYYALNRLGVICNMLNPQSQSDLLASNMNKAESNVLFVQDVYTEKLDAMAEKVKFEYVIVIPTVRSMRMSTKLMVLAKTSFKVKSNETQPMSWNEFIKYAKDEYVIPSPDTADNPAAIFYTGGTTGEPKGVLLTNNSINALTEQYRILTGGFERRQTWLTLSVPFIAYCMICSLHFPLSYGMEACIELYDNIENTAKAALKNKYNHMSVTPAFYEAFLKNCKTDDLSYIMMPISGGDKLSNSLYLEFNELLATRGSKWKLCNGYGMTEVGSAACVAFTDTSNKSDSVGIPFPFTLVSAFIPDTDEEVKQGESGEICISGPGLMLEYIKNFEATKRVIKVHRDGKRWMHTGDIGHLDEDGCVFIEGRIKRMIITFNGFKCFPAEIEEALMTSHDIENCSCVGMVNPLSGRGEVPVIFYVPKDQTDKLIGEKLKKLAEEKLCDYAQPYKYISIDRLPLTNAGKVDYRNLEKMLND